MHDSQVLDESQVEGGKNQNQPDVHHQTLPESMLEEQQPTLAMTTIISKT